jgi:hypothetical protein
MGVALSETTEIVVSYAVIFIALAFFIRAVRRHRKKPQLRMLNPADPANVDPSAPVFNREGLVEWAYYVVPYAIVAALVSWATH